MMQSHGYRSKPVLGISHAILGGWILTAMMASAAGPAERLTVEMQSGVLFVNRPIAVRVAALDAAGALADFSGSVGLAAWKGSGLLISELDPLDGGSVEFANVSSAGVDLAGWEIAVYDRTTWPDPVAEVRLPPGSYCPPRQCFILRGAGVSPGVFPQLGTGSAWAWETGERVAVLVRDAAGRIIDFVCAGKANAAAITVPGILDVTEWSGPPVELPVDYVRTWQRIGNQDQNSATDWAAQSLSPGSWNQRLGPVFPATPVLMTPTSVPVSGGDWEGNITFMEPAGQVFLLGTNGAGISGSSSRFNVGLTNDVAVDFSERSTVATVDNPCTITVVVTNSNEAAITDVLLVNTIPARCVLLSATPSQGNCGLSEGGVVCSLGSVAGGGAAQVQLVLRPSVTGYVTNRAVVTSSGPDLYLQNNRAAIPIEVRGPMLRVDDVYVTEPDAQPAFATFALRLSAPIRSGVSVEYMTHDSTAQAGSDYVPLRGRAYLPPGVTNHYVGIELLPDNDGEPVEEFHLVLTNVWSATLPRSLAHAKISDNDLPANDHFENASLLAGNTVAAVGHNTLATDEPGEPRPLSERVGKSVWWKWTTVESGPAVIRTHESDFDNVVAVFTGNWPALTPAGVDHSSEGDGASQVSIMAVTGTTYYIAVYGWNGASGNIRLAIRTGQDAEPGPAALVRSDFWDVDGTVHAMLVTNGTIYVGGEFSYAAPRTGKAYAVDLFTTEQDNSFPMVYGSGVEAITEDGEGGWFLGGSFYRVGEVAVTNLVHILCDGTVDPMFRPDPDNTVRALLLEGDTLYFAGDFLSAYGIVRRRGAAVRVITGELLPWDPQANRPIYALALGADAIYAGGEFQWIGGQARDHLAALDLGTGQPLPWNPGADGTVLALLVDYGRVAVGGFFTMLGGQGRTHLGAVEADTGRVTSWAPQPDGSRVNVLAGQCGTVFAGGDFAKIFGQARPGLAALNIDTSEPANWVPPISGANRKGHRSNVRTLAISGTRLVVGGEFLTSDLTQADLVALDTASGRYLPWRPGINGGVTALGLGGRKVVAGLLTGPGGVLRRNAAAFDLVSGRPTAWNPGVDGPVLALARGPESIFLGGDFTHVAGLFRGRLAACDPVTAQLNSWAPTANAAVHALYALGTNLLAGGVFTEIDGSPRYGLAAINTEGLLQNWAPYLDGPVLCLGESGGIVYVGGDFTQANAEMRFHLAAVNFPDGAVQGWNPDADRPVRAMAVTPRAIWVGGSFTRLGGEAHAHVAGLSKGDGQPLPWTLSADGEVYAFGQHGNLLYIGGSFTRISGESRFGIAQVDLRDGTLTQWDPGTARFQGVRALGAHRTGAFAGGDRELHFRGSPGGVGLAMFPTLGSPTLIRGLENQDTRDGSVALVVEATGQLPLYYLWTLDGVPLPGNQPTLVLTNAEGEFSVTVSNALGTATSRSVVSRIAPVTIWQHPQDRNLFAGDRLELRVQAGGQPAPIYQWKLNGVNIPGAVYDFLTVSNAQPSDSGGYSVVVANRLGGLPSQPAHVNIGGSAYMLADAWVDRFTLDHASGSISGENSVATLEPGEPLHAGKAGGKSVWLGWRAPLSGYSTFDTRGSDFDTLLAVYTPAPGGVSNFVTLASDEDGGGYLNARVMFYAEQGVEYAIAVDGFAGASGGIVLNWVQEPGAQDRPSITLHPVSQSVPQGGSAEFRIEVANITSPHYQWLFGCRELLGATNSVLQIPVVRRKDLGPYWVRIRSAEGAAVESAIAELELSAEPGVLTADKLEDLRLPSAASSGVKLAGIKNGSVAAGFISVPIGVPVTQAFNNQTATTGSREPGQCNLLGGASKWIGFIPANDGTIQVDTIGSAIDTILAVYTTNALFNFTQVGCNDNGAPDRVRSRLVFNAKAGRAYYALVDGIYGARGYIRLNWILGSAPVFTGAASTLEVKAGEQFELRALFQGQPPPAFQWRLNNRDLPGETSAILRLGPVDGVDAGEYSVAAYNVLGGKTNVVCVLNIEMPFRFEGFEWSLDGGFRLRLQGNTGRASQVEASSNLVHWIPITPTPVYTYPVYITDTNAGRMMQRYYRAVR